MRHILNLFVPSSTHSCYLERSSRRHFLPIPTSNRGRSCCRQFDAAQLQQNRAWPASVSSAAPVYIDRFGAAVRTLLLSRPHGGRFAFGVACSPTERSFLRSANDFFCRPASCTLYSSNRTTRVRLASMTSMFLKDPEFDPVCVDDCGGLDCNAYCASPSCWGR